MTQRTYGNFDGPRNNLPVESVGEVAKCYHGQFSETPATTPRAIFLPACTEFAWFRIVRESSANQLLIAQKVARKIRWDKPVSDYREGLVRRLFANCLEIAREFIFSRRALTA